MQPRPASAASALLCAAAVLSLCAGVVACQPTAPVPRNVLLITVVTLRADHLGTYGYARDTSPVVDELARRGVVFENAWVQWPKTVPSMASMFSATYPQENGVVVVTGGNWVPDRLVMLPEVLRERGFRTAAVVPNAGLGQESNFPQGFESLRELWMEHDGAPRPAPLVTDAVLEELERLAAQPDRFFLWVHYIDPHDPYSPPAEYAEPFLGDELYRSRSVPFNAGDNPHGGIGENLARQHGDRDDVAWYVAQYDGEIRYLDEHLGRLLEGLERSGVAGETLVALTADHGEGLGERDYYFHHGHLP
ncbi:MAG: sulfatase, partial [Myxococcota bacterium]